MDKISIHRALGELKLLDAKINKGIEGQFIYAKPASVDKISGVLVKDVEKDISSKYQSIVDLIERRNKIKSAIDNSNALTYVTVSGKKMTVSGAIDEKRSIQYKINLLDVLTQQYKKITANVSKTNEDVQVKSETFINNLYADKTNVDPNKIKELQQDYIDKNKLELIDPIGIKKQIDELSEYIYNFQAECDYVLSESNAVTFIEI